MIDSGIPRFGAGAHARRGGWTRLWTAAVLLGGLALSAGPAAAQLPVEWDVGREQMTRSELVDLLERIDANLASTAYSGRIRQQLERNSAIIAARLENGDFQVGDRIVLMVDGEPDLSDTLSVRSGQMVNVPVAGDLSLQGVLRSELEDRLLEHVGRIVREPTLRAQALIRISVVGEVENPGFYVVPAEALVTDVMMIAGGPTRDAKLDDLRIERGTATVWEGSLLQEAVIQGRTLDHLNVQAGDQVLVPREVQRTGWDRFQMIAASAGAIASVAFLLSQLF
jgi:protein involved in polysaccharide export with SLBB domain